MLSIFVAPISEERYQVLKKKEMTQLRAGLDCCLSDAARLETEDYFNERIRFKQKYLGWYSYLHYRVGVSVAPEDEDPSARPSNKNVSHGMECK